mmetsp:Transcript_9126/g.38360  ORF Transcript_9126/g.38360 Transcript_9126/m.38360 type:complete len:328 (+) Transcript_9126:860-1843(+)
MNLGGSSDASATPRYAPIPIARHSASSRIFTDIVSGNAAAIAVAVSASAVGVTTLGGAATSCLVSVTPAAVAAPSASAAATLAASASAGDDTVTVFKVEGSGFDLNLRSADDPRCAPSTIEAALVRNVSAVSPIQYLRRYRDEHFASRAALAASRPKPIHTSGDVAVFAGSPTPTRPTCLNGRPVALGTRVNAVLPALPLNSFSSTSSLISAPRPGAMPSKTASSAASFAQSSSHTEKTTMSAAAAFAASSVTGLEETASSACGLMSPAGNEPPLAANARVERRAAATPRRDVGRAWAARDTGVAEDEIIAEVIGAARRVGARACAA